MPKRFTDTEKWKKPFIRGLQGAYKLLWLYILDDCDHAGIWHVDFEVARIRIGEDVDKQQALNVFGPRVEVFGNGSKWFLRDFIDFQYGQLSEKNRLHQSVINILQKNELGPYKPLPRGQGQGTIQGTIQGIGQGVADEITNEWRSWGNLILRGEDQFWEQMKGRKVTQEELDNFYSVAVRNEWTMDTQQSFRITLHGFKPIIQDARKTSKGTFNGAVPKFAGTNYNEPL